MHLLDIAKRVSRYALRQIENRVPVRLRSLWRLQPIGRSFGLDRGWPIDRYYIDSFIARNSMDIRGRVLEAGGLTSYARRVGGKRVDQIDVLYPKEGFPDATLVGDLMTGRGIPSDAFDCVLLTQVLQFIYDLPSAVAHVHRALKPGGVVLATLPGISQVCGYDRQQWGEYWRFTDMSVLRLFSEAFGKENVAVEAHGNVLVACAFLQGLAIQDLRREELEHEDANYQFAISVRAVKQPTPVTE